MMSYQVAVGWLDLGMRCGRAGSHRERHRVALGPESHIPTRTLAPAPAPARARHQPTESGWGPTNWWWAGGGRGHTWRDVGGWARPWLTPMALMTSQIGGRWSPTKKWRGVHMSVRTTTCLHYSTGAAGRTGCEGSSASRAGFWLLVRRRPSHWSVPDLGFAKLYLVPFQNLPLYTLMVLIEFKVKNQQF